MRTMSLPTYHTPRSLFLAAVLLPALLAALLLLPSCASRLAIQNTSNPKEFALNLFRIADEGGERDWETQLSAARQAMGKEYVAKHFLAWKKSLLELRQSFGRPTEEVVFRVEGNRLEFEFDNKWYLLIHVAQENGALRVNQD